MQKSEKAVITVIGKDDVGILAAVAAEVAEANGNIMQVSQIVMNGIFTMTMMIEVDRLSMSLHEMEKMIKGRLPGMEIHVMHENIFNSMHSI